MVLVMGNFGQGQTIEVVSQETLTCLCKCPLPALPHQSLFSPDRPDQWPRVMVVSSFVCLYSTAHHCDGSTRPGWVTETPAVAELCKMYFWVGMLLVFGDWGLNPVGISF